MKNGLKHTGVVVPMITPITTDGKLDEAAVDRLTDSLCKGGVEGIFVLGTTGEGAHVPKTFRKQLVERVASRKKSNCRIYAGLGDVRRADFNSANEFFALGADAVVVHPPISERVLPKDLHEWYRALLDKLQGPALIYNMPSTTGVSIPLEVVEKLMGHPRFVGIKDSENNPARHAELLKRFGGRSDFSIFIGVGALMENGLRLGADGIVPSVGNLIPDICHDLCNAARDGKWNEAQHHFSRMSAVAGLYQKGRTLNESLAALKGALHCQGLCAPNVFPPLKTLTTTQLEKMRHEMERLHLLNGR